MLQKVLAQYAGEDTMRDVSRAQIGYIQRLYDKGGIVRIEYVH